jgi:hypothetical protein
MKKIRKRKKKEKRGKNGSSPTLWPTLLLFEHCCCSNNVSHRVGDVDHNIAVGRGDVAVGRGAGGHDVAVGRAAGGHGGSGPGRSRWWRCGWGEGGVGEGLERKQFLNPDQFILPKISATSGFGKIFTKVAKSAK